MQVPYSGFAMMTRVIATITATRVIRMLAFLVTVLPSPKCEPIAMMSTKQSLPVLAIAVSLGVTLMLLVHVNANRGSRYFTSVFVSLGVFLFGYDQGVMSGIIT